MRVALKKMSLIHTLSQSTPDYFSGSNSMNINEGKR